MKKMIQERALSPMQNVLHFFGVRNMRLPQVRLQNRYTQHKQNKQRAGFTMVELLVVSTIIIVLAAIGMVSYRQAGNNARNGRRHADLETVRQALVLYGADYNLRTPPTTRYPSGSNFNSMISTIQSYLGTTTVVDPRNTGSYVYSYSSDGSTFTLTGREEPNGTSFQVVSP